MDDPRRPPRVDRLRLVEPEPERFAAFQEMARETQAAGESRYDAALGDLPAWLERIRAIARGERLPRGHVPTTTWWAALDDGRLVGSLNFRHRLTPALEVEGGHIGYAVRPSERRKGYGTGMLALGLEKARERGLDAVLVTCDDDNVGSARIIERNGGVLAGKSTPTGKRKLVRRYWIRL